MASVAGTRHDAVVKAWQTRKRLHAVTDAVTAVHAKPQSREDIVRSWIASHPHVGTPLGVPSRGPKTIPQDAAKAKRATAMFPSRPGPEIAAYKQNVPRSIPKPPRVAPPTIPAPGDNAFRVHQATEMVNHRERVKKLGRELQKGF